MALDDLRISFDVAIVDDDQPASTLSFPDGSINVSEDAGNAAVMVNLSATLPIIENVTVRCVAASASAIDGEDFTAADQTLTFTPSEVGQSLTTNVTKPCNIPIREDTTDEADEEFAVTLSSPTGGATLPSTSSVNVTINDNDAPPSAWIEPANPPRLVEGTATTYDFTVRLSAASGKSLIALAYRLSGTATPGYDANLTPPQSGEDYTASYSRMAASTLTAKTVVGT